MMGDKDLSDGVKNGASEPVCLGGAEPFPCSEALSEWSRALRAPWTDVLIKSAASTLAPPAGSLTRPAPGACSLRRMLRLRLPVALTLLSLVPATPAPAADEPFRSCPPSNFECTRVTVPIDRSGRVAGSIRLYVERARRRGRGAVLALAGGPGQAATTLTTNFHDDFFRVLGARDLIVFDQRGTGRSGALNCPEIERSRVGDEPLDVRSAACAERLGPRRAFYTTSDSVEDIEAVRRRIRQARITLYGVSYGVKVAVAYALRYPQRVERLVLDSVVEPEGQNIFDLDTFAAMPRVFREICRGECRGVTTDLAGDVAALVDRMRDAPLRGPFVDRRGRRRTVEMSRRDLYDELRSGDLAAELRAEYPGAIRSALDGDPAPLLRIKHRFDPQFDEEDRPDEAPPQPEILSFTLFTATLCEEAPLPWERTASPEERARQVRERAEAIPDSAFEPFDRETSLASQNDVIRQCLRWPTAPDPPALAPGPLPNVPVLILEGAEDLRTPVEAGARLRTRFPRAQLVTVPKTAHSVLGRGAPCAELVLRRFFQNRPLGAPCRGARRAVRVRPLVPSRIEAVAPARGSSGLAGRTLAAVVLTLLDLDREYLEADLALERAIGGGLRGGRFSERRGAILLERFSLVPGVAVSGRLTESPPRSGRLMVSGSAAASGTLTLRRDGTLSGRLGGRRVSVRVRQPGRPSAPARIARAP